MGVVGGAAAGVDIVVLDVSIDDDVGGGGKGLVGDVGEGDVR
jgi:hypothetical protein